MPEERFTSAPVTLPGPSPTPGLMITGEVDFRNAVEFRRHIMSGLRDVRGRRMILDLAAIRRMDTTGAAVLVEALIAGRQRGVSILLCAASPSVLRIFGLAGLHDVLDCCCSDPDEVRRRLLADD